MPIQRLEIQVMAYLLSITLDDKERLAWKCWAGRLNSLVALEFAGSGFMFPRTEEKIKNFLRSRINLKNRRYRPVDDREAVRLLEVLTEKEMGAEVCYAHAP